MTLTRAIGVFGLVLGISGCAGTHHHHHAAMQPGVPGAPPVAFGTDCGCETHVHAAPPAPRGPVLPAQVAQARPSAAVVATTGTRSAPPSTSSVPPSSRPVAVPAVPPPSSRPIAVPAPAGVVRYLPMFDEPGTIVRSAWDTPPPDFLGVRTAMAADWPPAGSDLPPAPGDLDLAPPGQLPTSPDIPEIPSGPAPALPPSWLPSSPPVPDKVTPARLGQLEPRPDVIPVSAVVSVTDASAAQGKPAQPSSAAGPGAPRTSGPIRLEYTPPASLAGRPRWDPNVMTGFPLPDPAGSSSWLSQLALNPPGSTNEAAPSQLKPVPRDVVPAGRNSVVSRFVRRVRGAGRAFIEPESVK